MGIDRRKNVSQINEERKMKTSMLGETGRRELVSSWPKVLVRGVADEGGKLLYPGDLVRLPAGVRWGPGGDFDVVGTVTGFALDKRGVPSVVVYAPAWNGSRLDSWRTWIVNGDFCNALDREEAEELVASLGRTDESDEFSWPLLGDSACTSIAQAWARVMARGVRTKGKVALAPGDLVRLPRNVARNRGSQLHAAGLCLGYAIGLDGSPCIVVDAVGEDVPTLTRWRTWVVRGTDVIVIDTKEAWRLEGMYDRSGRVRPKKRGR